MQFVGCPSITALMHAWVTDDEHEPTTFLFLLISIRMKVSIKARSRLTSLDISHNFVIKTTSKMWIFSMAVVICFYLFLSVLSVLSVLSGLSVLSVFLHSVALHCIAWEFWSNHRTILSRQFSLSFTETFRKLMSGCLFPHFTYTFLKHVCPPVLFLFCGNFQDLLKR